MYYTNHFLLANPTVFPETTIYNNSVVYVFYHGRDGAIGYVINQRMYPNVVEQIKKEMKITVNEDKLYVGGDRQTSRGLVFHTADYATQHTQQVNKELSISGSSQVLNDINRSVGPNHYQIIFGCLEWKAGELDREISTGSPMSNNKPLWLPLKFDKRYLFSNTCWNDAMVTYAGEQSQKFLSKF
jgi:putative transcriptional regulator